MINFNKLAKKKSASPPARLVELFEQLDRKTSHQILRPVQVEALDGLDKRITERDVVLKVSTGSGKTLVGLLYAEFLRRKCPGEVVLYLCPTNQLVEQVLQTAAQIGVAAEAYSRDSHDAAQGEAVAVCTYDRLFNAKNTFEKDGIVPCAIILDDVHSGIDRVRQKYTVAIPPHLYEQVRDIFRPLCEGCDPAVWRGIANSEADARFEVPFWVWIHQAETVARLLEEQKDQDHDDLLFSWGNISRYIEFARLCITGTQAELSLAIPCTEENRAYANARHRLFMSASIKDGTSLIKDLACESEALSNVIEPVSDKGAGERMVLPVSLIDPKLKKEAIADLCEELSQFSNVVILTSSGRQSGVWVAAGAEAKSGREVDKAVAQLRNSSKGHFVVFAQRFDGVDLPDDACRILVVDGTPTGDRICDQIDAERQKNSPGYNVRVVNRVEQALGRAVRSSADFAAILLVGGDLASFVGRKDVKQLLEPHTREQIDLGRDLAEQLRASGQSSLEAIAAAIQALLDRDEDWKETHRDRVASIHRTPRNKDLSVSERAAVHERRAWECAKARNYQAAVAELQTAVDDKAQHDMQRAELIFRMAGYMHHFDAPRAASLYRSAFQLNTYLPRPIQMPDRKYMKVREQAAALSEYLQMYASAAAAVARLEEIRSKLAYAGDAESVERSLYEFGELLGASSSRPEKETGRGPDVLWMFDGISFCIEAKSEKKAPIFKSDAEQLLLSMQWCVDYAGIEKEQLSGVFVTDSCVADRKEDISFSPNFMTEEIVMQIADDLSALINGLSFDGPLFRDAAQINRKLHEAGLTGKELAKRLRKASAK